MKNYFFFAIYILLRPSLLKLIFKGIYLPVYLQYEWLKKYHIGTFVDVGALDGHVSKSINHIFPKTKIFVFEPILEKYNLIKSKIKSSNIIVENIALSDRQGESNFHEYDYTGASSLLYPEPKNKEIFGKHILKSYPVKLLTLDKYFKNKKLKKPIVLKMDTQGTENLIIKGGGKFLKDVSLIIVETSFVNFYQNQCSFEDIYLSLEKLGFVYKGKILDSDFYPFFGLAVQENSVFIRSSNNAKLA